MDRNTANVLLACMLETIGEATDGAPAGAMYAALMGRVTHDEFEGFMGVLVATKLVVRSASHLCTLTAKGREMVAAVVAARGGKAAPAPARMTLRYYAMQNLQRSGFVPMYSVDGRPCGDWNGEGMEKAAALAAARAMAEQEARRYPHADVLPLNGPAAG